MGFHGHWKMRVRKTGGHPVAQIAFTAAIHQMEKEVSTMRDSGLSQAAGRSRSPEKASASWERSRSGGPLRTTNRNNIMPTPENNTSDPSQKAGRPASLCSPDGTDKWLIAAFYISGILMLAAFDWRLGCAYIMLQLAKLGNMVTGWPDKPDVGISEPGREKEKS
jgi:hypothetical protein